jgi:glycosyltransferase involved in cell wall biosynthesis
LKILFLVTEDRYFWSYRLALARKVRDMGAEVLVMTRVNRLEEALKKERFRVIPWRISRGSLNPFRELLAFVQVLRFYWRERPDLVHHVALKPLVHGGLAARVCGNIASVNEITGLGHVFISQSHSMRLLRCVLLTLLRIVFRNRNAITILQNADDRNLLVQAAVVPEEAAIIIRGSSVNPQEFSPQPEPDGVPIVVLATRMLWEKGVGEFVNAANKLRESGVSARFVLVGDPDPANPASIPPAQLRAWVASGAVEWWGHRNDMPAVFALSNVVCLPSYGEGVPRVLVEAAACGRPIVTTDVPGCREVVRHGENGLLVPPRDPEALAEAIATLLKGPALRARMGARGREIAVQEFSEERVVRETLEVYRELLGPKWPGDSCR